MEINAICCNNIEYCRLTVNPRRTSGADLHDIFDQHLLSAKTQKSVWISKKSVAATKALNKEIGCAVSFSK